MTDVERITKMINEIDQLILNKCDSSDTFFQAWKNEAELFIVRKYGQNSLEYKKFGRISFYQLDFSGMYGYDAGINQVEECKKGLLIAKAMLKTFLEDVEGCDRRALSKETPNGFKKVFIVHGHDGKLKEEVARIVEKQNIEAIILSEKANQGRTIIEKFENYSDVGGAICLFTADDVGREKNDSLTKSRARQNVVFETGYFMGKLGRDHIVLLADGDVEMPSDLSGVVYTNTNNWQFDLLKELKAMGYAVDMNKLF